MMNLNISSEGFRRCDVFRGVARKFRKKTKNNVEIMAETLTVIIGQNTEFCCFGSLNESI